MPAREPLRIGFLVDALMSRYQLRLFTSIERLARQRGARLIGFQGSYLTSAVAERPVFDGSFLYQFAGPASVDGLIVVANVLASGVGSEAVRVFCQRSGVPVVSIGELAGFPHVEVDNDRGLRGIIEHLVQVHGRRRLGFIRGPRANPDSIERERIYRATLETLGVPVIEDHIFPGNFLEASGANAVRTWLDERGLAPDALDALVAANDQMAVGAVQELSRRGLHVPRDIAVVGFDDDDHARSNNPPLTTVCQPIERMGERAVELLLESIAGHQVPDRVLMNAEPVWRRSCGCGATDGRRSPSAEPGEPLARALARRRTACVTRLERMVGSSADPSAIDHLLTLLEADEPDAGVVKDELEAALIAVTDRGVDALRWQDVMQPIEEEIERRTVLDGPLVQRHRRRMLEARLLINEIAARSRTLDQLHSVQRANSLRVLGSAVACARNFRALARVLEAGLPSLAVSYCCVCLFNGGTEERNVRVVALFDPAVAPNSDLLNSPEQLWRAMPASLPPPVSLPPAPSEGMVFPASELLHAKVAPSSDALDLLVYPLVFAEDALGYVVFDAPRNMARAWLLEGLAGHLSSAIYSLLRADELRHARELAETASAAKSEFVAMISHEVRTPLTAIMGHIDLCLQSSLSSEQRTRMNRARASSRALLGIVNDILDFSKIEARKLELESVRFDLDEVLDQVIGTSAATAARKGLEFVVDVDPEVPRVLTGDPLRLTQVLLNLVGNAVKFSSEGHIVVRVEPSSPSWPPSLATLREDRVFLTFSVADTGIGMSAEQIERVFEPFTQADSSMIRRYGGTGLGLTVSRRLVELMGGELKVVSKLGRGSEFRFACGFKGVQPTSVAVPDGLGRRALVVDDSELSAGVLGRALRARGYEVAFARDGAAALALVRADSQAAIFDAIFVDYGLPDGNGLELVRRLGDEPGSRDAARVLLSPANADFLLSSAVSSHGVASVIAKPFQRVALSRALARVHSGRASSRPPRSDRDAASLAVLSHRRILVVQDDEVSRELARDVLAQAGADVQLAADGFKAVELATQQRFDLVLMDLYLPVLDGCGAARAIRNDPRSARTPILALTASSRAEDRERCLAAGMSGYLCTPLDAHELLAAVRRWTGSTDYPAERRMPSGSFRDLGPALPEAARATQASTLELDVQLGLSRLGGDSSLYRRLLRRFALAHRSTSERVRRAFAEGQLETAILLVHTLASAAANIGAAQLSEFARAFEAALRRKPHETLEASLAEFERMEAATLAAINAALATGTSAPVRQAVSRPRALEALFTRLRALLEEHDTAAVDCLESLRDLLGPTLSASDAVHRLEASIDAYDFERARHHLEAVESSMLLRDSEFPGHAP